MCICIVNAQEIEIHTGYAVEQHSRSQSGEFHDITITDSKESYPVRVEIVDGMAILDGDIILGSEREVMNKAAVILGDGRRWPGSIIPYVINNSHPDQNMIKYAINHINQNTNLCMVARSNQEDYVEFVNSNGCSSYIGKIGNRQVINVSQNCGIGATIHEILHAAGHYHEQSRADRDTYVTINSANIQNGAAGNFNIYGNGSDIGPYDYASLMHYDQRTFSVNGPSIEVKMPPGTASTDIGQRVGMSVGDVNAVNSIHPAVASCGAVLSVPANLGYKNPGTLRIIGSTVSLSGVVVENRGTSNSASQTLSLVIGSVVGNTISLALAGNSVTIPVLPGGGTFSSPSFTYNGSGLSNGTYIFFVFIDPFSNVNEGNENDNQHRFDVPELILPIPTPMMPTHLTVTDNPASGLYQATQTVQSSGNVEVAGSATFQANLSILLNGGFEVKMGGIFTINIGGS